MQSKRKSVWSEQCSSCGKTRHSITSWLFKDKACRCSQSTPNLVVSDETGAAKTKSAEDPSQPDFGSRFKVIAKIGNGGMGTVYQVNDVNLNQEFALKVLNHTFARDKSRKKRFIQEIKALEHLDHTGIVTIYGGGEAGNGLPYMIMEYIAGKTLADTLKEKTSMDSNEALPIFFAIAEAVDNAHVNGVIHRDLKPSNIMLIDNGESPPKVKIVDFGISKVRHEGAYRTTNLTQTGEIFGSPYYMSPEQCEGVEIDKRSDVYSFGGVMYEVLTGTPPFSGGNAVGIIMQHMSDKPKPFDVVKPDNTVPPAIEAVILKCLEKSPDDRYQSMNEVADALKLAADCKPAILMARKKTEIKNMYFASIGVTAMFLGVFALDGKLPFQFKMPEREAEWKQLEKLQKAGEAKRISLEAKTETITNAQQFEECVNGNADLHSSGLVKVDLSGKKFENLNLAQTRFINTTLSGATFVNCNFELATFEQCTARGAIFSNCNFGQTQFKSSDFGFSRFNDCDLTTVSKSDALEFSKPGHMYSRIPPDALEPRSAKFDDCSLSGAIFDKCWFGWAVLDKCNLARARFILCPRGKEQVDRGYRLRNCETIGVAFN